MDLYTGIPIRSRQGAENTMENGKGCDSHSVSGSVDEDGFAKGGYAGSYFDDDGFASGGFTGPSMQQAPRQATIEHARLADEGALLQNSGTSTKWTQNSFPRFDALRWE